MIVIYTKRSHLDEMVYINPKAVGKFTIKLVENKHHIYITNKDDGVLWEGFTRSAIDDESIINALKGSGILCFTEAKEDD